MTLYRLDRPLRVWSACSGQGPALSPRLAPEPKHLRNVRPIHIRIEEADLTARPQRECEVDRHGGLADTALTAADRDDEARGTTSRAASSRRTVLSIDLSRIQDPLRVERGLDSPHQIERVAVLSAHIGLADRAGAVLAGDGAAHLDREPV